MKKWKSLFACGLVLLLTGWTMLCIPFNAYAQTWEAESTSTNIVAVVDCSTSMQSSDSDWKIPESLDMLVDMCDDEQVRLSLIVYGTSAETAFRDFPLSAENHEMVKKQIHQALMVRGYNLGQTDTGAALGLAQQILEQQAGQNNMVLLFTDGAIRATRNGRTNEISEQEVDAFAAFAQNNGVVVNTLGLFNKQADAADVETAEEELSILRSKTGGMYQRVDDPADIPDFVIQLLAGLLDVKTLDLSSPTETTVDGKHAWQYDFHFRPIHQGPDGGLACTGERNTGYSHQRSGDRWNGSIPEQLDGWRMGLDNAVQCKARIPGHSDRYRRAEKRRLLGILCNK